MEKQPLITIATATTAELIEKKSRFIGQAFPVNNEQEAQDQLAAIRTKHRAARHKRYA